MPISTAQYQAMLTRNTKLAPKPSHGVKRELALHDQIIRHCNSQFPRWKYIHANPVTRSTIAIGCQDFTIFLPGRVLCVECKRADGKLSPDQLAWQKEMEMIGHTVHVVRSMDEFLQLL